MVMKTPFEVKPALIGGLLVSLCDVGQADRRPSATLAVFCFVLCVFLIHTHFWRCICLSHRHFWCWFELAWFIVPAAIQPGGANGQHVRA